VLVVVGVMTYMAYTRPSVSSPFTKNDVIVFDRSVPIPQADGTYIDPPPPTSDEDEDQKGWFLNNFYENGKYGPVDIRLFPDEPLLVYTSSEAAYQVETLETSDAGRWRSLNLVERTLFLGDTPTQAWVRARKMLDNQTMYRRKEDDHDLFRSMKKVVLAKFSQNQFLKDALLLLPRHSFLLQHSSQEGEEGLWTDNKNGEGANWLGLILMLVRDELRYGRDHENKFVTRWIAQYISTEDGTVNPSQRKLPRILKGTHTFLPERSEAVQKIIRMYAQKVTSRR
jgi:hypothetical protein